MISHLTKPYSFTLLLFALCSSNTWAQKPDHLSMNMHFNDSTVSIEARYRSFSPIHADSIYFLLNPGFELDTIQSNGLTSYSMTQKAGIPIPFFLLEFNELRKSTETMIVDFEYTIDLSEQNHMRSDWIELNADKLWFPNLGALNNEFTYEVTINNLPQSYHLITHTDAEVTQEKNTYTIHKDKPWFEVLVLAGKDLKKWEYDQNLSLIGREDIADSTIRSIGLKVRNSIDTYNGSFGISDPISSFQVVLRNTTKDELGYQYNRRNLIVTGTDFNDYGNLSHEIAHYWWSEANFIDEPWMNESFANYSMYLVLEEFDPADNELVLAANRELSAKAIPVANASLFAADSYNSYYHKGAFHLISLEEKIGSELMGKLLSSCVRKHINTTEQFLDEIEKLTDRETRNFFDRLLKS